MYGQATNKTLRLLLLHSSTAHTHIAKTCKTKERINLLPGGGVRWGVGHQTGRIYTHKKNRRTFPYADMCVCVCVARKSFWNWKYYFCVSTRSTPQASPIGMWCRQAQKLLIEFTCSLVARDSSPPVERHNSDPKRQLTFLLALDGIAIFLFVDFGLFAENRIKDNKYNYAEMFGIMRKIYYTYKKNNHKWLSRQDTPQIACVPIKIGSSGNLWLKHRVQ